MSAHIMVDLDRVHPVSGGRWHRVFYLQRLPQSGEQITMLCGLVDVAEYVSPAEQTTSGAIPTCCWSCDLKYRQQQGIPVRPDHPGLTELGLAWTPPMQRRGWRP